MSLSIATAPKRHLLDHCIALRPQKLLHFGVFGWGNLFAVSTVHFSALGLGIVLRLDGLADLEFALDDEVDAEAWVRFIALFSVLFAFIKGCLAFLIDIDTALIFSTLHIEENLSDLVGS